jgi:predicted aldo/keto reductase-like oxidoreductase
MAHTDAVNGIPTRVLGSTGERVTILGVGGHHMAKPGDRDLAVRIIRTAIDEGINFLDNAWCYHRGNSERYMGEALRDGYRDKVFLMTKNHGRDGPTFRRQLEDSLSRLQTDHIDLLQFHEIIHDGEPERIFSEGAIEEALKARDEGKIRFIGFTGHRWPYLFKQMLETGFQWDTVQMPINLLDHHFRSFAKSILPILLRRGIGVIGMKSLGGSEEGILKLGITPEQAISYSLSKPIDTLVSGVDSVEFLHENLEIVRNFQPLTQQEQEGLLKRVAPFAEQGYLEYYKTGW